jgi:hypothetical protein
MQQTASSARRPRRDASETVFELRALDGVGAQRDRSLVGRHGSVAIAETT